MGKSTPATKTPGARSRHAAAAPKLSRDHAGEMRWNRTSVTGFRCVTAAARPEVGLHLPGEQVRREFTPNCMGLIEE